MNHEMLSALALSDGVTSGDVGIIISCPVQRSTVKVRYISSEDLKL